MTNIIELKGVPRKPGDGPPKGFRKVIPLEVKLKVLLRQGHVLDTAGNTITDLKQIQWDHTPPLQQRLFNKEVWDTLPPANDPNFITARESAEHKVKTATKDIPEIAKTKRLTAAQLAFRNKILSKDLPEELQEEPEQTPKRKIPSRRFPISDKQKQRLAARKGRLELVKDNNTPPNGD